MPIHALLTRRICVCPAMLLAAAFCCLPLAQADIYRHVDSQGRVTFSNLPMKGAKRLDLGPIPQGIAAPRSSGNGRSAAASTASPADFPKVDSATQNRRDLTRRQIWQDELSNEERLLAEARKELNTATADKAVRLRDDIKLHEKNIDALKKEMARAG